MKRKTDCALAVILILALGTRLAFAKLYYFESDLITSYLPAVYNLLGKDLLAFSGWDQWYIRLGLIMPSALCLWLIGQIDTAILLTSIPFSLAQVFLVFLIGRRLWDERVGLIAALFEAFHPLSVIYGSRLLPDTLMAFWVTAALFFFLCSLGKHQRIRPFLAGLCMGIGYTVKFTALFVSIILIPFYLINRRECPQGSLYAFVLGGFFVLIVETLLLSLLQGDFNFRPYNLLYMSSDLSIDDPFDLGWERYFPGFFSGLLYPLDTGFPYHALFGIGALVVCIVNRKAIWRGETGIIFWWWTCLLLLLNFACLGFDRPIVYTLQMRYMMFITPAACLLVAYGIKQLSRLGQTWTAGGVLIVALSCSFVLFSTWQPHNAGNYHLFQAIQEQSAPNSRIYFHHEHSLQCTRVYFQGSRTPVLVRRTDQLINAEFGDLATVIADNYTRGSLEPWYIEELESGMWEKTSDWQHQTGVVQRAFEVLGIPVKKGFDKRVQIFHRR